MSRGPFARRYEGRFLSRERSALVKGIADSWVQSQLSDGVDIGNLMNDIRNTWSRQAIRVRHQFPYALAEHLEDVVVNALEKLYSWGSHRFINQSNFSDSSYNPGGSYSAFFTNLNWWNFKSDDAWRRHPLACIGVIPEDGIPTPLRMAISDTQKNPNGLLIKLLDLGLLPDHIKEKLYIAMVQTTVARGTVGTPRDVIDFDVDVFGQRTKFYLDLRSFCGLVELINDDKRGRGWSSYDNQMRDELFIAVSSGKITTGFLTVLDRVAFQRAEWAVGAFALDELFYALLALADIEIGPTGDGYEQPRYYRVTKVSVGQNDYGWEQTNEEREEISRDVVNSIFKQKYGIPLTSQDADPTSTLAEKRDETLNPIIRFPESFVGGKKAEQSEEAAPAVPAAKPATPKKITRTRKKVKEVKADPSVDDSRTT